MKPRVSLAGKLPSITLLNARRYVIQVLIISWGGAVRKQAAENVDFGV